jgi:DNA-binding MarR family transcriptional regulator
MKTNLIKTMRDLAFRMRLLKARQEDQAGQENLTERELLILELLSENGPMPVSHLSAADPCVSDSTISSTITKLWRNEKMVTKTISPENQRTTIIGLTDKGKKVIDIVNEQRGERFEALLEAINLTNGETEVLQNVFDRAILFFDKHLGICNRNNLELVTKIISSGAHLPGP